MPAASLMCAAAAAKRVGPVLQSGDQQSQACRPCRSNSCRCLTVVANTVFRFLMTSPIAWSRSASVAVS